VKGVEKGVGENVAGIQEVKRDVDIKFGSKNLL